MSDISSTQVRHNFGYKFFLGLYVNWTFVASLAYVEPLAYVWHKSDLGLFVNRAPGQLDTSVHY